MQGSYTEKCRALVKEVEVSLAWRAKSPYIVNVAVFLTVSCTFKANSFKIHLPVPKLIFLFYRKEETECKDFKNGKGLRIATTALKKVNC